MGIHVAFWAAIVWALLATLGAGWLAMICRDKDDEMANLIRTIRAPSAFTGRVPPSKITSPQGSRRGFDQYPRGTILRQPTVMPQGRMVVIAPNLALKYDRDTREILEVVDSYDSTYKVGVEVNTTASNLWVRRPRDPRPLGWAHHGSR